VADFLPEGVNERFGGFWKQRYELVEEQLIYGIEVGSVRW